MAQRHLQLLGLEVRIPGTDGAPIVIEHAHHLPAEVLNLADRCLGVGAAHGTSRREAKITEVRLLTRAGRWAGDVQTRPLGHWE